MQVHELARPQGCTNLKLRQASRLVSRLYDAELSPTGLHKTQYSLLSHVVKLGAMRAGDLARAMRLDASTLSRNLQPLVQSGWVEVTTGDDARQRVIRATKSGVALRAEAQRAWKRAQLTVNARVGEAQVAELHDVLDRLISVLGDGTEPD
ncbi:MAG: MarR family winged helix-turn-helix transcriptional regulator [Ideonella sp.]|jgi:DNA-binding MarR family transcriptional regulator|nr:MarR family winged helix-turn-helix transcriptional regulator [Ideonella sp.]